MSEWTVPRRKPNPNALANLKKRSQQRAHELVDNKLREEAARLLDIILADSDELGKLVTKFLDRNSDEAWRVLGIEDAVKEFRQESRKRLAEVGNVAEDVASRILKDHAERLAREIDDRLEAIEKKVGRTVLITRPDTSIITVKNPHRMMPELLRHIQQRLDTALVGPSGSGKTHAARQVADILDLPFYFIACSDSDMPSKWLGYYNANGRYVESQIFRWYTTGGVLLIDEYDNMRDSIGVSLNAMLGNGIGDFPHGTFDRHPDAICVAAGNTIGRGATTLYRARHGLDESTIERFTTLEWGYDEDLELALAQRPYWAKLIQAMRKVVAAKKMEYLITPRAILNGDKLLNTGLDINETLRRVAIKGWPRDDAMRVLSDPEVARLLDIAVNAHEREVKRSDDAA